LENVSTLKFFEWIGRALSGAASHATPSYESRLRALSQISLADAAALANDFIGTDHVRIAESSREPNADQAALLDLLAIDYGRLLRRRVFETVNSDLRFGESLVRRSPYAPGYIAIGESTEHTEITCQPNALPVYLLDGLDDSVDTAEVYPSLFHYILLIMSDLGLLELR
jgi:hypothetical protein